MNLRQIVSKTRENFLLSTIKLLVFAIFLIPLVSVPFFLYHNEEQTYLFRIIVEIAFSLWIILNIKNNWQYAKKIKINNLFSFFLVGFLFSAVISTVFGIDPTQSFWSDFIRTMGLLTLVHMYAFFAVVVTVFDDYLSWEKLFNFSILVALICSFLAISEKNFNTLISLGRISGPIGNPAFFATFLIFNIFFAIFIAVKGKRFEKISYSLIASVLIATMFLTGTRGAIVALVLGLMTSTLLAAFFITKKVKIFNRSISLRKIIFTAFGVFVIGLSLLTYLAFSNKSASWVQQTPLRYVTKISLSDGDIRLRVWKVAFEGFKERPIIGWGLENFSKVHVKYFDPGLYKGEFRFDRAHNIIFDTLINQGLVGLILYLGIFFAISWALFRGKLNYDSKKGIFENSLLSPPQLIAVVFAGLFVAYLGQNFFVFDTSISLTMFFMVLAFIFSIYSVDQRKHEVEKSSDKYGKILIVLVLGLMSISVWYFNIESLKRSRSLVALQYLNNKPLDETSYQKLREVIDNIPVKSENEIDVINNYFLKVVRISDNQNLREKAIELVVKNFKANLGQYKLSPVLGIANIYAADVKKNPKDFDLAVRYYNEAIKLSPKKQDLYYRLTDFYLDNNKPNEALSAINKISGFDPKADINTHKERLKVALQLESKEMATSELNTIITQSLDENSNSIPKRKDEEVVMDVVLEAAKNAVQGSRSNFFNKVFEENFEADIAKLFIQKRADSESYFRLLLFEIDLGEKDKALKLADYISNINPIEKEQMSGIKDMIIKDKSLNSILKGN